MELTQERELINKEHTGTNTTKLKKIQDINVEIEKLNTSIEIYNILYNEKLQIQDYFISFIEHFTDPKNHKTKNSAIFTQLGVVYIEIRDF